jgi:hypothetical protein
VPLTPLQQRVLLTIRSVRHPGSHVAGSLPLHAATDSDRESRDIDLFHDAMAVMHAACAADLVALEQAGFQIRRSPSWSDTFRRALVTEAADSVEIDWAVDAAWRFFPPMADPLLGWRLHDVDLACNKALALAGRSETRDLIDILAWDRCFGLAAIVWAACGKDPGSNPLSLLEQMRRSARIDPGQMLMLKARRIDPLAAKQRWLAIAATAEEAVTALADAMPPLATGIAFIDRTGAMRWPDPRQPIAEQGLAIHAPSVGGCVPLVHQASTTDPDPAESGHAIPP